MFMCGWVVLGQREVSYFYCTISLLAILLISVLFVTHGFPSFVLDDSGGPNKDDRALLSFAKCLFYVFEVLLRGGDFSRAESRFDRTVINTLWGSSRKQ